MYLVVWNFVAIVVGSIERKEGRGTVVILCLCYTRQNNVALVIPANFCVGLYVEAPLPGVASLTCTPDEVSSMLR